MAGAFSRKTSGISCDLTAFRIIKEHRANAVETPLGVTGVLPIPHRMRLNDVYFTIGYLGVYTAYRQRTFRLSDVSTTALHD